jgi:hypothetical protein
MKSVVGASIIVLAWVAQAAAGTTTAPVPEPGTMALLAAGAAAVAVGTRWFRRK